MSCDDVAPESRSGDHRPFEVDATAGTPSADRRPAQGRFDGADGETVGIMLANRETNAVHSDALSVDETGALRADVQLAPTRPVIDRADSSDFLDQAREHA